MGGFRELRWVIPGNMCGNLVSKLNIKISESVKLHTGDSLGINTEMLKSWTKGLNQGNTAVVGGLKKLGRAGAAKHFCHLINPKYFFHRIPKKFCHSTPKHFAMPPPKIFCHAIPLSNFLPPYLPKKILPPAAPPPQVSLVELQH